MGRIINIPTAIRFSDFRTSLFLHVLRAFSRIASWVAILKTLQSIAEKKNNVGKKTILKDGFVS